MFGAGFGFYEAHTDTVDGIKPALPQGPLNYGNSGIFLIMGNAGVISSTVGPISVYDVSERTETGPGFIGVGLRVPLQTPSTKQSSTLPNTIPTLS